MKTGSATRIVFLICLMLVGSAGTFAADSESAILSSRAFNEPIVLTVGQDDAYAAQFLASRGSSIRWWDEIAGTKQSCRRVGGYNPSDTEGGMPTYSVSGNSFTPDQWFNWLVKHNYIRVQNFSVLLTNTPWGKSIPRSYQCFLHIDGTEFQRKVGNVHTGGSFAVGQRQIVKWTYKNSYETPMAGKGNVKVFAGRFEYQIRSLFPDIAFEGLGSGSGKAYLDPDSQRWMVAEFNMNDPRMTLISSGPQITIPPMLALPAVPPPPTEPVFFKERATDYDWSQDSGHCKMDEINGLLKGKSWTDCVEQKGWRRVDGGTVKPQESVSASAKSPTKRVPMQDDTVKIVDISPGGGTAVPRGRPYVFHMNIRYNLSSSDKAVLAVSVAQARDGIGPCFAPGVSSELTDAVQIPIQRGERTIPVDVTWSGDSGLTTGGRVYGRGFVGFAPSIWEDDNGRRGKRLKYFGVDPEYCFPFGR